MNMQPNTTYSNTMQSDMIMKKKPNTMQSDMIMKKKPNTMQSDMIMNMQPNTTYSNKMQSDMIMKKKPNTTYSNTMQSDMIMNTKPSIMMQNQSNNKNSIISKSTLSNFSNIHEDFTVVNLDSTNNIPVYYNLFNTPKNINLSYYLKDNYTPPYDPLTDKINNVSRTYNTYNEDSYNAFSTLNLEIEKEISNLNLNLNGKNDKIINSLDKMRVSDMANDYYFLQNLVNKK